jgi:hypothetical protein
MIEIRQPTFEDLLFVSANLRAEDVRELSITRNDLDIPSRLATAAWCAKYRRCAYLGGEPTFAFGVSAVAHDHGQAWGFGTKHTRKVIKSVTKFIIRTMVPEMLHDGLAAVQALGQPENRLSARWLGHLGFTAVANLAGIGAGGEDLFLWVTTADEHRHNHLSAAA